MPLNRRIFTLKASELRTEVHSSVPEKSLALPLESDSHASSAISCRRQMAATIRIRSIWAVATVTFALVAGSLSWASEPATSPEAAFVQKTISSHKIVIFSKSYCPYSKKAKGVFKELNQVAHVIELDQRDDGQSIQDALNEIVGKRTVPQVFIDGKHLGGSDATVEAYESGELAKLLGIAISPEAAFINETIASHRIVIFSKSYCPYCKKAKGVFKELNQVPHVVELDQRDDGQAIQDAMSEIVGKRSVPQVFIDGKHIGGSDATVEAYETGELAKLLGIATSKAAFVKETIGSYKIVIFSKSYCPYCKKAKGVFKELNQVPHVVELDQRDDGQAIQDALSEIIGKRSVPQVFIEGKHIGGSDATVEAYESGELAKLLGIATSKAAFVKETISSHKIVIFSKSYCPYCKKAKGVFKELDQAPHIIELDQREDGQDIQDALSKIVGRRTVPQVFIDGKHLGGSDDTVQAYESGELAKLLGIAVKNKEEL